MVWGDCVRFKAKRFSKILDIKKLQEDLIKEELSALNVRLKKLKQKEQELAEEYITLLDSFSSCKEGKVMTMQQLWSRRANIERVQQQQKMILELQLQVEEQIKATTQKLCEKHKEVKIMEKLVDRFNTQYKLKQQKDEQALLDDVAIQRHSFYKKGGF